MYYDVIPGIPDIVGECWMPSTVMLEASQISTDLSDMDNQYAILLIMRE